MNLFQQDNLLLIKKNKLSDFYDTIVDGILEYSPPKKMTVLEWDNQTNVFQFNKTIENIIELGFAESALMKYIKVCQSVDELIFDLRKSAFIESKE